MKRTILIIALIVVIAIGVTACKKAPVMTEEQVQQQNAEIVSQAAQTGDQSVCSDVSAELRESCIVNAQMTVAINAADPSLCESISVEDAKASCKNTAAMKSAIMTQDATKCDLITDERLKVTCLNALS